MSQSTMRTGMTRELSAVAVALCIAAACITAASAGQTPKEPKSVDRTTPILNKITPAQREHAELHRKRRSGGRSRSKVLDDKVLVDVSNDYRPAPPTKPARLVFEQMACSADNVFAGTVTSSEVLPVTDGTALFSDYHVAVTHVFTTARNSRLFSGDEVVVTRPGGITHVEGEEVGTRVGAFPPLLVGGHYLFFVKYLPKYKTYDATGPLAVLSAYNGTIRSFVALNATDADLTSAGVAYGTVATWLQGLSCK